MLLACTLPFWCEVQTLVKPIGQLISFLWIEVQLVLIDGSSTLNSTQTQRLEYLHGCRKHCNYPLSCLHFVIMVFEFSQDSQSAPRLKRPAAHRPMDIGSHLQPSSNGEAAPKSPKQPSSAIARSHANEESLRPSYMVFSSPSSEHSMDTSDDCELVGIAKSRHKLEQLRARVVLRSLLKTEPVSPPKLASKAFDTYAT
eukprot:TRINITY_DN6376_c0_g2_i2.p1 TRINITY_DN6376_c0_g2~~TRINITY_DN6376_c0_g2_i2.p1  ORF type:complete len:199 (+),score=30.30 TRINITY_DN6376_c0_g2_i2:267-863(+)